MEKRIVLLVEDYQFVQCNLVQPGDFNLVDGNLCRQFLAQAFDELLLGNLSCQIEMCDQIDGNTAHHNEGNHCVKQEFYVSQQSVHGF